MRRLTIVQTNVADLLPANLSRGKKERLEFLNLQIVCECFDGGSRAPVGEAAVLPVEPL
jgi:hypothetical protein